MTRSTIDVRTCDRCNTQAEIRAERDAREWGQAWAMPTRGQAIIGTVGQNSEPLDVCPSCMKELEAWWKAGRVTEVKETAAKPKGKPSLQ